MLEYSSIMIHEFWFLFFFFMTDEVECNNYVRKDNFILKSF